MTGMYNLLFGVSPVAGILIRILGVDYEKIPRFRDCFVNENDEIVIFTRTGGPNRPDYEADCKFLEELTGFLVAVDDEFDATYCHFRYEFPANYRGLLNVIRMRGLTVDMAKRWSEMGETVQARLRHGVADKD